MFKLLKIKNIALISNLEIEFGPGLTTLTGETGAGKSILVGALGLLLGDRASSDSIRSGEELGVVEACVESRDAGAFLEARGLPSDEGPGDVLLRREVHTSGKNRAMVNGALVPVGLLRELAPLMGAIHGQHEHRDLLDPENHLALVDHHGGLQALAATVAETFRHLKEVEVELRTLEERTREGIRLRDTLEFQASEIEAARVVPGEEEALKQEKLVQANAARVLSLASEAYNRLYEDDDAVLTRLGHAFRKLEELATIDPRIRSTLEARAEVTAKIEDVALFLRDYRQGIDSSPGRLDGIESRLALIERLKGKYGSTEEEILAFAGSCRSRLEAMGSLGERKDALEEDHSRLCAQYLVNAGELSQKRRLAAGDLETRVETELSSLAMEKARFRVGFSSDEPEQDSGKSWSAGGLESAELLLSANPGEDLRPLARVASGGELSRILLALKSVVHLDARGKTLVFDEVDAGIGGRVAEVVGRKLKALAHHHQVFCVTHLPQIACLADHHYAVRKRMVDGRTITEVRALEEAERVEEVARMLGGERVTEAAMRHAREMVEGHTRG